MLIHVNENDSGVHCFHCCHRDGLVTSKHFPHYCPFANEILQLPVKTSQWCHNEHNSVSNHQRLRCLLNCRIRPRSKNTPKLRVTGLCAGNLPVTGEFPAQRASNAENVSIWWRHHGISLMLPEQTTELPPRLSCCVGVKKCGCGRRYVLVSISATKVQYFIYIMTPEEGSQENEKLYCRLNRQHLMSRHSSNLVMLKCDDNLLT